MVDQKSKKVLIIQPGGTIDSRADEYYPSVRSMSHDKEFIQRYLEFAVEALDFPYQLQFDNSRMFKWGVGDDGKDIFQYIIDQVCVADAEAVIIPMPTTYVETLVECFHTLFSEAELAELPTVIITGSMRPTHGWGQIMTDNAAELDKITVHAQSDKRGKGSRSLEEAKQSRNIRSDIPTEQRLRTRSEVAQGFQAIPSDFLANPKVDGFYNLIAALGVIPELEMDPQKLFAIFNGGKVLYANKWLQKDHQALEFTGHEVSYLRDYKPELPTGTMMKAVKDETSEASKKNEENTKG